MKRCRLFLSRLLPLLFIFLLDPASILPVLLAALIHEGGHLAAARLFKMPLSSLTADVSGVRFSFSANLASYKKDALLALAGPAANLLAALLLIPLLRHFPREEIFFLFFAQIGAMALNLLPLETLDGGRALYALLCLFFSPGAATGTLRVLCPVILVPLTLFGVYLFSKGEGAVLFLSVLLWAQAREG